MLIQQLYQIFEDSLIDDLSRGEISSVWRWVEEELISQATAESQLDLLHEICDRLRRGEPIQYITGRAYFYGLELKVDPTVLIPRPETEELVHHALKCLRPQQRVLDIGTGSGCIPVSMKHQMPELDVWACDVSKEALIVARENADLHQLSIHLFEADLTDISTFGDLPEMDMIVSNPPYIQEDEKSQMSANTSFEPDLALFSPEDALWAYRHIVKIAEEKLKQGGFLFFELNEFKAQETLSLVRSSLFKEGEIIEDMQGKPRVLKAIKI